MMGSHRSVPIPAECGAFPDIWRTSSSATHINLVIPPHTRPVSSPRPAYDESPSQGGHVGYPVAAHHAVGTPDHNWQRLEARWQTISRQMQELETEMDKVLFLLLLHTRSLRQLHRNSHIMHITGTGRRLHSHISLCSMLHHLEYITPT
ncbi:hypothetical protein KUCAC02_021175 [Chaenocephalus aceratus]|uniref:Uncharacterized protein n=1 Tax=Chaenocephalus aceratus TaxID=36190 RepID=A0ACB9XES6_CHAAC|nr:hypothetical protein KUCAC02_021175 [Chaenocephalus aceratus]